MNSLKIFATQGLVTKKGIIPFWECESRKDSEGEYRLYPKGDIFNSGALIDCYYDINEMKVVFPYVKETREVAFGEIGEKILIEKGFKTFHSDEIVDIIWEKNPNFAVKKIKKLEEYEKKDFTVEELADHERIVVFYSYSPRYVTKNNGTLNSYKIAKLVGQ